MTTPNEYNEKKKRYIVQLETELLERLKVFNVDNPEDWYYCVDHYNLINKLAYPNYRRFMYFQENGKTYSVDETRMCLGYTGPLGYKFNSVEIPEPNGIKRIVRLLNPFMWFSPK